MIGDLELLMRSILICVFSGILLVMLVVTAWASMERSVFTAGYLFEDRWFVATFCDAYCGFSTFYVWVACRESRMLARIGWFIAIMALGNIAMAVYVLLQLWKLGPSGSWRDLLVSSSQRTTELQTGEVRP